MAKDLLLQKRYIDDINLTLSDQIGTVELGLAQDLETLKCNVEEKTAVGNAKYSDLEQQLKDFTIELDIENGRLRMDLDAMKLMITKLQKKNVELDFLSFQNSINSRCSSCTNCSNECNVRTRLLDNVSQRSHSSDRSVVSNVNDPNYLYMFGDTSRSIIVDRVAEKMDENLKEIMVACFHDINLDINGVDIEFIERIGTFDKNKRWPRPVKITFRDSTIRDQVLYFKLRLRHSNRFSEFMISREEPKEIRINRAKLRQAADIARQNGHNVIASPDRISIDNIEYNLDQLESLPNEFKPPDRPIPPVNPRVLNFFDKCRRKAERIIMVGPSLQKTVRGLAFCSANSFLSNFYICQINYRGQLYNCLEQGYQAMKARICRDDIALGTIMNTDSQILMKRTGQKISTTEEWESNKIRMMEELLFSKFRQNKRLYYLLLNTRPHNLIEGTLDTFWGAGCRIGSIALEEGIWTGQNHLGKMLMYIRGIFAREIESGKSPNME